MELRVLDESDNNGNAGGNSNGAARRTGILDVEVPVISGNRLATLFEKHRVTELLRTPVTTFQVNVGKLCNQACHHCHVDAGPLRTENMTGDTADRLLEVLENSPRVEVVDITGGAPELNPHFSRIAKRAFELGKKVIVRCNLTVIFLPGMEHLPTLYTDSEVEIIASLPCYLQENVDKQRGSGVFRDSIEALRLLNRLGYAREDSGLTLHLVFNPLGASLPPPQADLAAAYKKELKKRYDIVFNQLFTITNMPIKRFAEQLTREGKLEEYMSTLVNSFNVATLDQVMCRSVVSLSHDGKLYDCDFNQMLEMPLEMPRDGLDKKPTLWDIDSLEELEGLRIQTADHCLGCTAGAGSSCTGALN
jgi:radical SAM/Cys-rich protein